MYEQHAHQMVDKVEATNINSQTNTYIFLLSGQDISIYFHLSSAFFCPPSFINFSNVGTLVLKNCHMRLV